MNSSIKQRPILFSTEMVQAILAGRKTMTRRIAKPQPALSIDNHPDRAKLVNALSETDSSMFWFYQGAPVPNFPTDMKIYCPYGQVGDILWVRETHYRYGHWKPVPGVKTPTGRQKWAFIADTEEVRYFDAPPAEYRKGMHNADPGTPAWHKRLARFMPKAACRLFLRIDDYRFERLQDISEEDAEREGILVGSEGFECWDYSKKDWGQFGFSPTESFQTLWESINGSDSWNANPWVWVVSFERISKP